MTSNKLLKDLLDRVARGDADPADALEQLVEAFRAQPFEDLGFATLDSHRGIRRGFPEAVYGQGKTDAQIASILERLSKHHRTVLATRVCSALLP